MRVPYTILYTICKAGPSATVGTRRYFGREDMMTRIRTGFGAQHRRAFLTKTAPGAVAAAAILPRAAFAAETVNIGALYPTTGSFAQIGQGCVNAAKIGRASCRERV